MPEESTALPQLPHSLKSQGALHPSAATSDALGQAQ